MKPSHALSVWLEDQTLCVELPGTGEHSHTIRLMGDEQWPRLFQILQHRDCTTKIGEVGDPTQYQLDKQANAILAKANGHLTRRVGRVSVHTTPEQRAAIDQILREMGLA